MDPTLRRLARSSRAARARQQDQRAHALDPRPPHGSRAAEDDASAGGPSAEGGRMRRDVVLGVVIVVTFAVTLFVLNAGWFDELLTGKAPAPVMTPIKPGPVG